MNCTSPMEPTQASHCGRELVGVRNSYNGLVMIPNHFSTIIFIRELGTLPIRELVNTYIS